MADTVSDFLLNRLSDWGVKRIFGFPGDGINGIMGAMDRASEKIDFVQVRHEEMAAFMACAHAKFTGEVGVCVATSGPGAVHLLNGLYDAKLDHQPVVAIVGQQARAALGGNYQQEIDLMALFKDVAHEYVHMVSTPSQMRHLVDRAMRIAQAERCVCCIIVPNDIQEMDAEKPARAHGTVHSGIGYHAPRVVPEPAELQRAADVLNAGKKVAMLVGADRADHDRPHPPLGGAVRPWEAHRPERAIARPVLRATHLVADVDDLPAHRAVGGSVKGGEVGEDHHRPLDPARRGRRAAAQRGERQRHAVGGDDGPRFRAALPHRHAEILDPHVLEAKRA